MDDVQAWHLRVQSRQRLDHRLINRVRALTSPEDEQSWRLRSVWRDSKKGFANRNARHFAIAKVFAGLFKMHGRGGDETGDNAIGKARNHVGLEGQRRNTAADGGNHSRAGGIAADSNDRVGTEVGDDSARCPKGAGEIE